MDLSFAKTSGLSFMKTGHGVGTSSGNMSCVPTAVYQGHANTGTSPEEPGAEEEGIPHKGRRYKSDAH